MERTVEAQVARLLNEGLAQHAPSLPATIARVDFSCELKTGNDGRALVTWAGGDRPHPSQWTALVSALVASGGLDRVVAVPPGLRFTLAQGTLEAVVAELAGQDPATPPAGDEPGVVLVFCSPNTNKPLHVGHLRACFLGSSISRLFEASGVPVRHSQMLSNFGIHMCQALSVFDEGDGPEIQDVKPDWFVGDLYRRYHQQVASSPSCRCPGGKEEGQATAPGTCPHCRPSRLLQQMLAGDPDLVSANRRLGEWAIEGIRATQSRVGARYDTCLRESETISVGIDVVGRAVQDGICKTRPDGSVYADSRAIGTTELTLLRHDGTPLVYCMLVGIYLTRAARYPGWRVVELTGEQWRAGRLGMYELLERLGRPDISSATEGTFFGMIGIAGRPMQSRNGNVVLADDVLDRTATRVRRSAWFGERAGDDDNDDRGADRLAVALLKYHILGVPRSDGFDFDEERMWADASARIADLQRLLRWSEQPADGGPAYGGPAAGGDSRALALLLARAAAVGNRALDCRDPAIVVRFLEAVVDRWRATGRNGGRPSATLRAACGRVVRQSLGWLDISLDLEPSLDGPTTGGVATSGMATSGVATERRGAARHPAGRMEVGAPC